MSDLIRRSDAIKAMDANFTIKGKENMQTVLNYLELVRTRIEGAPTIEPKQGEWIAKTENYHSHWVCSECGSWALLEWNEQMCLSKYCPNCGAKMKGADDDC